MKRTIFILLMLICALTLCACVLGGEEEPDVTDPIYSYDIDVCVYDPDPAYEPKYYYDLSFRPYDKGYFIGGVNAAMYTLKAYYTEPNGQGIKICDADGIYTQEFKDYVVSTGGKLTYTAYPVAERVKCTVTVVTGTDRQIGPFTVYSGEEIRLPMDLERYGYTFDHWEIEHGGYAVDGVVDCYGQAVTVYAMYRPIETYIKYQEFDYPDDPIDPFGGKRISYEQHYSIEYEEYNGYNFKGYFSEPNGAGIQYTDEEGNSLAPWDYVPTADEAFLMYAYHVEAPEYYVRVQNTGLIPTYAVTLVDCDIDPETEERVDRVISLGDGEAFEYLEPELRDGEYFDGWYYLVLGHPVTFEFTETIEKDITLYPRIRTATHLYATPVSDYSWEHVEVERDTSHTTYSGASYVFNYDCRIRLTIFLKDPTGYGRKGTVRAENKTKNEDILAKTKVECNAKWEFELDVEQGEVIGVSANFAFADGAPDGVLDLIVVIEALTDTVPKTSARVDLADELPKKVTKGNTYRLDVYQQEDYTFLGYYTEPNGKGIKLTDEKGKSLGKYTYDGDVMAYAHYKKTE